MGFEFSPKVQDLRARLEAFMSTHVYPNEAVFWLRLETVEDRWISMPIIETLKTKAKAQGLWNLFLPHSETGPGLTNLEYAPLAEIMGRVHWGSRNGRLRVAAGTVAVKAVTGRCRHAASG